MVLYSFFLTYTGIGFLISIEEHCILKEYKVLESELLLFLKGYELTNLYLPICPSLLVTVSLWDWLP